MTGAATPSNSFNKIAAYTVLQILSAEDVSISPAKNLKQIKSQIGAELSGINSILLQYNVNRNRKKGTDVYC